MRAGSAAPRIGLLTGAILLLSPLMPPPLQAQEGQIIVIRPVPSRPATRPGVPAPPLAVRTAPPVDVSPARPIRDAVGLGVPNAVVLSDTEAAAMSTGAGLSLRGSVQSLGGRIGRASNSGGHRTSDIGQASGGPSARQFGGVATSVPRATGGLGRSIVNAVAPR